MESIKLLGTRVRFWESDNKEITIPHIKELVEYKPDLLVIGLGAGGLLTLAENVQMHIHQNRVKYTAKHNDEAIKIYNKALAEGKKVAAIFPNRG